MGNVSREMRTLWIKKKFLKLKAQIQRNEISLNYTITMGTVVNSMLCIFLPQ